MRVMFVVPGAAQGSSMIFVRRQADSLTQEGVEVHSFYLRSRTSLRALARELFRFRAELARVNPEVVHAQYGTMTAIFAALTCGRRPLIVTYRGSDLNPSVGAGALAIKEKLGRVLSQLAALRAARTVCVSRALRERLWWRRSSAIVLPTGVDCRHFYPESRDIARARLEWLENDRVVLFNAGHDPQVKRLDLAMEAASVAQNIWPDLRLEILNGAVDPERIPTLMNGSDCLLVTSDSEGSPSVVQEALVCGLPIVSVNVGDVTELLDGVANTKIVERDAIAIARALVDITAVPRRTNGPAAAAAFSSRGIAQRLCALYREVAPEPRYQSTSQGSSRTAH